MKKLNVPNNSACLLTEITQGSRDNRVCTSRIPIRISKDLNSDTVKQIIAFKRNTEFQTDMLNQVLLLRQIWIVNHYFKCLSDNLSIEKKHTGVSREMLFQK